jgi:hypothetical protein
MNQILYYKEPAMATGRTCGGDFTGERDMKEFIDCAPGNMPENTLFYYRDRMLGKAWILRDGKILEIWNPHIYRKYKFTLADVMRVAPTTPTEELITE